MAFKRYLPVVAAVGCWQVTFVALLCVSLRTALDHHLATAMGIVDDPFAFEDFVLPVWYATISVPSALISLAVYRAFEKQQGRFSLKWLFALIAGVAIPLALGVGDRAIGHPTRAILFVVYLAVISGIAWRLLHRTSSADGP